ncbi:MAG: 4a-hydroxytetrahydrobiopterin dehydratase [Chloroflexi bacterium]|nr:4a-hydroxytetrahydrobiopterin dehydratase [Chloroflexota bacterium]
MPGLSEAAIAAALASRPGWSHVGDEIVRMFQFPDFVAALAFVVRVGDLAEAAGHHPDIDIRYNRVRLALTTHDQGGLTDQDLTLAGQIDTVA